MKIKKLIVSNFRNIVNQEIDLTKTTILLGKNGIGKSNNLNALNYLITDTLFTDKYGFGENDIDTIIPIQKSVLGRNFEPTIEVIFEDGTSFKKVYKTKYSKGSDIQCGHTTDCFKNGVVYSGKEFTEELYEKFGFTPSLKINSKKPVSEVKLFTDTLYALQKLDAQQLRALLVAIGCGVSNEEMYALNPDYVVLRQYESKYDGHFERLRVDLKRKSKELEAAIDSSTLAIEMLGNPQNVNSSEIEALNSEKEQLQVQKLEIKNKADYSVYNDIKTKIDSLNVELSLLRTNEKNEYNNQVKELKLESERLGNEYRQHLNSYKLLEQSERTQNGVILNLKNQIVRNRNQVSSLAIKYQELKDSKYSGLVECPHCHTTFAPNEIEQLTWETNKECEMASIEDEINTLNIEIENDDKQVLKEQKELENILSEKVNFNNKINELKKAYDEASANVSNVKYVSNPRIKEIEDEIKELEEKQNASLDEIKQSTLEEIASIDSDISNLNLDIESYYQKKGAYDNSIKLKEALAKNREALNDNQYLLGVVDSFIQNMIKRINYKAKEKTGIDFVMLEQNLSNDGVSEVCYATINGVEFNSVNTAEKLRTGIKFIERLKELCGSNDLPIMADRLESIDDINSINELTKEQLVCTRVTTSESIEVQNEN